MPAQPRPARHLNCSRFLLATLFLLFAEASLFAFRAPDIEVLTNYDRRMPGQGLPSVPAAAQVEAARVLEAERKAQVQWDALLASPRWVLSPSQNLYAPAHGAAKLAAVAATPPDPYQPVKDFLHQQAALFGHDERVLETASVRQEYVTEHNRVRTVVWQQEWQGIPLFETLLVGHITAGNELAALSSRLVPDVASAVAKGKSGLAGAARLTAAQAVVKAAAEIGETLMANQVLSLGQPVGLKQTQLFAAPALKGEAQAQLAWLPTTRSTVRLSWEVTLTGQTQGYLYRVLVDAETGSAWLRQSLTCHAGEATYNVFVSDSPTPMSPGWPSPNSSQPPVVARQLLTFSALNTNASPFGWLAPGGNETLGNNVDAHWDRDNSNLPNLPRAQGSPPQVFDFPLDLAQAPTSYSNAAVVQLFYWCNWAHDKYYELGFTEATGNFQQDNYGRGGFANDVLLADAQDGGGVNNANMSTPPDGNSPRMQMYLWDGPQPNRDGCLDGEIVLHEFTHGVSGRLIGGGAGISALQTAGMGEGWSDFMALSLLSGPGDDPDASYAFGAYVSYLLNSLTENYYYGIRRYPYSTATNLNPLTFKDIDPNQFSSHSGVPHSPAVAFSAATAGEVHHQGEVWCTALWEARANLIHRLGPAPGNQLMMRLVVDGLKYSPPDPSFVEARDAILLADRMDTGGVNRNDLWAGFAKRGLGAYAEAPDSTSMTGIVENYSLPDDLEISPRTGLLATGPVGGGFSPGAITYTLTNAGLAAFQWAAGTGPYLDLSLTSGPLAPGGASATLVATISAAANSLPAGDYTNVVSITNLNTGVVQFRSVRLRIAQIDFLVENFDNLDFDLAYQSVLFTPDGSLNFYRVCRQPATSFPTDPAGGAPLALGDDTHAQLDLTNGLQVGLFGSQTGTVYVGSNGEITYEPSSDAFFYPELAKFFELKRVGGLYTDLNPLSGGAVSWKQLADRVAVTWENVPEYGKPGGNNLQIELFADGRIRLTWLAVAALGGRVGLSPGLGIPTGFSESDFSSYALPGAALSLALPAQVGEGDGVVTNLARLLLLDSLNTNYPASLSSNVVVTLTSGNTNRLRVPASVVVSAWQSAVPLPLTVVDNTLFEGNQDVMVQAAAPGLVPASATLRIIENDPLLLSVAPFSPAQTNLLLSWPAAEPAPVLEINTNLGLSAWQPVTNGVFTSNGQNRLLLAPSQPREFFRLRWP